MASKNVRQRGGSGEKIHTGRKKPKNTSWTLTTGGEEGKREK